MRHSVLWDDSVHRLLVMWRRYPEIMESGAYIKWNENIFNEVDIGACLKEKK